MLVQEVAQKYANALFLSVKDKGLVDAAYDQFGVLKQVLVSDPALVSFLSAPQILEENKRSLIANVFGDRLDKLFVEFLLVLVHKHRIGFLAEVIDEFIRKIEADKGLGRVTVFSAVALSESERADLTKQLAAKTGLKIILEEKIKPDVLGGIIVVLHNEIIDGTVRHGLDVLREQLAKVRVH